MATDQLTRINDYTPTALPTDHQNLYLVSNGHQVANLSEKVVNMKFGEDEVVHSYIDPANGIIGNQDEESFCPFVFFLVKITTLLTQHVLKIPYNPAHKNLCCDNLL